MAKNNTENTTSNSNTNSNAKNQTRNAQDCRSQSKNKASNKNSSTTSSKNTYDSYHEEQEKTCPGIFIFLKIARKPSKKQRGLGRICDSILLCRNALLHRALFYLIGISYHTGKEPAQRHPAVCYRGITFVPAPCFPVPFYWLSF